MEQRVIGLRGLTPDQEPFRRFMTPAELRQRLVDEIDEDAEDTAATQDILRMLGLLKETDDLRALQIDLLSDQVLGLFDTETGELMVIADKAEMDVLSEFTYAHEFTHALQQARFGLATRYKQNENDSEAFAAFLALVEGDAVLLQTQYLRHLDVRKLQQAIAALGDGNVAATPFVLRESLAFPYLDGLAFVQQLFASGGWPAVDEAYASPPVNTEQVIHIEKYRAREAALPVTLPDVLPALGAGWSKLKTDYFGELSLRIFLDNFLSSNEARRSAAGWGGDQLVLFGGPGGQRLMVGLIRWDTLKDAGEFWGSYGKVLKDQDSRAAVGAQAASGRVGRYQHTARRQGSETLLIVSTDPRLAAKVLPLFPAFPGS